MKLTKKYRIWWKNNDKTVSSTYDEQCLGTVTTLNENNWNYFESDNLDEIENKIQNEGLSIEQEYDL